MIKNLRVNNHTLMTGLRTLFVMFAFILLLQYLYYILSILPFPYDWEPTDGDHLNFAHRIALGLPIYYSIKNAQILSIYNPLYHAIVAILGGPHAGLILARSLAFLFWFSIPMILLFQYIKQWGYFYSFVAAILVFLPITSNLLLDMVHVSPNSLMACLFFISLVYADNCYKNPNKNFIHWMLVGMFAALCFLAKQQGLIAIAVIGIFLLIKRVPFRAMVFLSVGFLLTVTPSILYLETINSGHFLQATVFELSRIMVTIRGLSATRLGHFLGYQHSFFTLCVILSFVSCFYKDIRWSIWHASFVLHIGFLLITLGNPGGGDNYFATFWITMVILSVDFIQKLHSDPLSFNMPLVRFIKNSVYLLIGLVISFGLGAYQVFNDLQSISKPNADMHDLMQNYYQQVQKILLNKPHANILVYRNIGALINNSVNVENEGATLFNYGFAHPDIFDTNKIIQSIHHQRYDFITTGLQPYPEIVQNAIDVYYQKILSHPINLNMGKIGVVSIYAPKAIFSEPTKT